MPDPGDKRGIRWFMKLLSSDKYPEFKNQIKSMHAKAKEDEEKDPAMAEAKFRSVAETLGLEVDWERYQAGDVQSIEWEELVEASAAMGSDEEEDEDDAEEEEEEDGGDLADTDAEDDNGVTVVVGSTEVVNAPLSAS